MAKDKEKKVKDPNKPKRGNSAFMFFAMAQRPKVKAANPDMSFGDLGKELGRLWGALSAAQKAPYEKEAVADKERYEKEMKKYKPPQDDGEKPKKKSKKA